MQGTPPGLHDVHASAADWDLIMKRSHPASRRSSGTSTPPGPIKKQVHPLRADLLSIQ